MRVRKTLSEHHTLLELYRFRGRWQLATEDALYSDGAAYTPLRKAFKALGDRLQGTNDVLVLGAGLGSAVWTLQARGLRPQVTLVDWDETILRWAIETLEAGGHSDHVTAVCDDAAHFVAVEEERYDLLIVDLFRGRLVPPFATEEGFLRQCAALLRPTGVLVLNYIENEDRDAQPVEATLKAVFPAVRLVKHDINRIFLAAPSGL